MPHRRQTAGLGKHETTSSSIIATTASTKHPCCFSCQGLILSPSQCLPSVIAPSTSRPTLALSTCLSRSLTAPLSLPCRHAPPKPPAPCTASSPLVYSHIQGCDSTRPATSHSCILQWASRQVLLNHTPIPSAIPTAVSCSRLSPSKLQRLC